MFEIDNNCYQKYKCFKWTSKYILMFEKEREK